MGYGNRHIPRLYDLIFGTGLVRLESRANGVAEGVPDWIGDIAEVENGKRWLSEFFRLLEAHFSLYGRFGPGDEGYVRLRHASAELAGEDAGDKFRFAARVQRRSIVDGCPIALL
jgi:hypothetical protein